jgi:hypothetical protein
MATLQNLAARRQKALEGIIATLQAQATQAGVILPEFPVLRQSYEPLLQHVLVVEWIHGSFKLLAAPAAAPADKAPTGGDDKEDAGDGEDEGDTGDDQKSPATAVLNKFRKEELLALAAERKIDTVSEVNTKAEIIAALTRK